MLKAVVEGEALASVSLSMVQAGATQADAAPVRAAAVAPVSSSATPMDVAREDMALASHPRHI